MLKNIGEEVCPYLGLYSGENHIQYSLLICLKNGFTTIRTEPAKDDASPHNCMEL